MLHLLIQDRFPKHCYVGATIYVQGYGPPPSPYVFILGLMNLTAKYPDRENGSASMSGLEASSRSSKPAPNHIPTTSSNSDSDASDHALSNKSPSSSAKDPASSVTSEDS